MTFKSLEMLNLVRNTLYPFSKAPNIKPVLGVSLQMVLTMWPQLIRYFYFLLSCFLLFTLQKHPTLPILKFSERKLLHNVLTMSLFSLIVFKLLSENDARNGMRAVCSQSETRRQSEVPSEFALPLLVTEGSRQVTLRFELHSLASSSPIPTHFV